MTTVNVAEFLAVVFERELRAEIGEEQYVAAVAANNAENNAARALGVRVAICHSHDYTDANQVMLDAFRMAVGRDADVSADEDIALLNSAWDLWQLKERSKG